MNIDLDRHTREYTEIFALRGHSYDAAMRTSPRARDLEFRNLFLHAPARNHEIVLDVPSLGGYLAAACPGLGKVFSLDFAPPLQSGVQHVDPTGSWPVPLADRMVCLAASHHIEDLEGFLVNASRHLRQGARIHLADVERGSPIGTFLDDFVGRYTPTGHRGIYRDFNAINYPSPLVLQRVQLHSCPWRFGDAREMVDFCRKLFFLQDVSDGKIHDQLVEIIGVEKADGYLWLQWRLAYVELVVER